MYLCLVGNNDEYNKYTVLHETGHALGFEHEHQHPDSTDVFNEREIIEDQKNGGKTEEQAKKYYDINYAKPQDLSKHIYMASSKYDPDSIMRYW